MWPRLAILIGFIAGIATAALILGGVLAFAPEPVPSPTPVPTFVPAPTPIEADAIAAVLAVLRRPRQNDPGPGAAPAPPRWAEAGRREALRLPLKSLAGWPRRNEGRR